MPAKRSLTLALALLLVAAIPARATGTPSITVVDVNPGSDDSYAMDYTPPAELNGFTYFSAETSASGEELWRTNGVETELVEDIRAGSSGSSPQYFTALGDWLYFRAYEPDSGHELWRTNGTVTTLVFDISTDGSSYPQEFVAFGSYLYFSANTTASGRELWRTNGTVTEIVEDINVGASPSTPRNLTPFGSYLYFQAENGTTGPELWRTNGTVAEQVAEIRSGASGSYPDGFTALGSWLYFEADTDIAGTELWRTNGSVTEIVEDIYPGADDSFPKDLIEFSGYLYFRASDDTHGRELWRTNGTTTELVQDSNATGDGDPDGLTLFDGALFMELNSAINGEELCWIEADSLISPQCWDLRFGPAGTNPQHLTVLGDYLYFMGVNNAGDDIIWRISQDRTRETISLPDGVNLDCDSCEGELFAAGSRLYMTVNGTMGYEFAYLIEPTAVLPETNRDDSTWSTALVLLAAATAAAGLMVRMRASKR